jgi:hypothetical protein
MMTIETRAHGRPTRVDVFKRAKRKRRERRAMERRDLTSRVVSRRRSASRARATAPYLSVIHFACVGTRGE